MLSAPSDHYRYSDRLIGLSTGQSFEITFKVVQMDMVSGEDFLHAVEFWITTSGDPVQIESGNIALGFGSTGETEWRLHYYVEGVGYIHTRLRFQVELAQQRFVRISRRSDGIAEFFLDGVSVLTVADPGIPAYVRARVVGSTAEFSYLPIVSTATAERSSSVGPRRCEQCPVRTPP